MNGHCSADIFGCNNFWSVLKHGKCFSACNKTSKNPLLPNFSLTQSNIYFIGKSDFENFSYLTSFYYDRKCCIIIPIFKWILVILLLADSAGELSVTLSLSLLYLDIKRFVLITKREQARAKAKHSSSVISQKGKSSSLSRPLSADGKVRKDIIITYTNSPYLNLSYILIYPYTLNGNLAFHE